MIPERSLPKRAFRIATLFIPSWLAWYVAFTAPHKDALAHVVALTLGPMWAVLGLSVALRTAILAFSRNKDEDTLAQVDVLTASGSGLAWTSAFAIMCAVWIGWASLAVVGLLGTGLFHVVVLFALASLRRNPLKNATIERRFSADVLTEGEDVLEEIVITNLQVPVGFRLFATGSVGARWPTTRYVVEAADSGGEVVLESEIGPALRGEHDAPPLAFWLEDTFGFCRSVRVGAGARRLTVLPKVPKVEKTAPLMAAGNGPRAARSSLRPTEGCLNLREYQQGDDVRRIHWVRSLAAGELIVRLPDELPPDRPRVRVVLDTFFPEVFALNCEAPAEVLDSLVGVWMGVARSLVEAGIRTTLVAAIPQGDKVVTTRHELSSRAPQVALRIGAQVGWQNRMPVSEVLTDEPTLVISHSVLSPPPPGGKARWIIVAPTLAADAAWPFASSPRLPYPMGAPDNRWSRRRRAQDQFARRRRDHGLAVVALRKSIAAPPPGSFSAQAAKDGTIQLEVIS